MANFRPQSQSMERAKLACLAFAAICLLPVTRMSYAQSDNLSELVIKVRNPSQGVRNYAVGQLRRFNDPRAVKALESALHDPSIEVRQGAVSSLKKIGDPRARKPLLAMLKDSDSGIRLESACALVQFHDLHGFTILIDGTKGTNWSERSEATAALGKTGDARAIEPLLDEFQRRNNGMQRQVEDALIELKNPAEVAPLIAILKAQKGPDNAASRVLGKIGPPAVEPLIAVVNDKTATPEARGGAINALGNLKDRRAVDSLIAAMQEPQFQFRGYAANALGEIGDPRSVAPLIAAFENPRFPRGDASEALVRLRDPHSVPPLIAMLASENSYVRNDAASVLGEIGDPRAVEPLIETLKTTDRVAWLSIIPALGKIGDRRSVKPLLAVLDGSFTFVKQHASPLLGDPGPGTITDTGRVAPTNPDAAIREAAITALGNIGDPSAIPAIAALVHHPYTFNESVLIQSLTKFKGPAVDTLTEFLHARESDVRFKAVKALGTFHDPRAVDALLAAVDDPACLCAQEAIRSLIELKDPRAMQPLFDPPVSLSIDLRFQLMDALKSFGPSASDFLIVKLDDPDAKVEERAALLLGSMNDTSAVPTLVTHLRSPNPIIRQSAASALMEITDPSIANSLAEALKHGSPDERESTACLLGQLGDHRALKPLIAVANSNDRFGHRFCAVTGLGNIGDRRAIPALTATLRDSDENLRRLSAASLSQFKDARVVPLLTTALKDNSSEVQKAAANSLRWIDPTADKP